MIPHEIQGQVQAAQTALQNHLGCSLLSLHLYGSALIGGLQPLSDIDLLATTSAPVPQPLALAVKLLTLSTYPPRSGLRPLEVTIVQQQRWVYPPRREFQFGEWLRDAIIRGHLDPPAFDPDLAILLSQARRHSLPLHGPPVSDLFEIPHDDLRQALRHTLALWDTPPDWEGDETNVVLTLARVWYTLSTDQFLPKDRAAGWALEGCRKL